MFTSTTFSTSTIYSKTKLLDSYCPGILDNVENMEDEKVFLSTNNCHILLFSGCKSGPSNAIHRGIQRGDRWEGEQNFILTRTGKMDDETCLVLKNHEANEQHLYLFQQSTDDQYFYKGEFVYTGCREVGLAPNKIDKEIEYRLRSLSYSEAIKSKLNEAAEVNEKERDVDVNALFKLAGHKPEAKNSSSRSSDRGPPPMRRDERRRSSDRNSERKRSSDRGPPPMKTSSPAPSTFSKPRRQSGDSTPIRYDLDESWLAYVRQ